MQNKNLPSINQHTGEIMDNIIEETDDYIIKQLPNGDFKKQMKYSKIHTNTPTDEKEQIELYNVFNSDDNENVVPLKNMIDKKITIQQFYTNPYESFDEKTGANILGVTTTIFDGDTYYATSSKSVYYTILNLADAFGYPADDNYRPITVKVTGTKRENGIQINLQLVGLE